MRVQSILYFDWYGTAHPTGMLYIDAVTAQEVVMKLRALLSTDTGERMQSIQAFTDDGRFFLVHHDAFVVTYYGRFKPKGDAKDVYLSPGKPVTYGDETKLINK